MASPPYVLATTTPADNGIVSQFPLDERTLRDIIQSWILANHDSNGNHTVMNTVLQSGTPATPSTGINSVYADVNGRLKYIRPDGTVNFVGIPPGTVIHGASSSTPVGYLIADGSAVSRSTYADLFTAIGTTYGAGDGSTTFNLPDLKGRVIAGEDSAASRLTTTYFGTTANLAAVGGSESTTLTLAQLPTGITSANTATVPLSASSTPTNVVQASISNPNFNFGFNGAVLTALTSGGTSSAIASTGTVAIGAAVVTSNNTTGSPHRTVPPTIILRALIKT